jgi:hypothetical protein
MIKKDRTTVISPSNVLQLPRYNHSYSVVVAAVGGTITKFSVETSGTNCFVTLFVNDRALPGATNIPVSATVSQVDLKEKVRTDDAITLIINSTPTYYPPEGSSGPSAKRRWRHHHHHHVDPETPPPVVANLSYTLWIEQ